MTAKVLLADDQALFRRGISAVLHEEADIEVVAEVEDGSAAIKTAIDMAPDVVLMDVRMPKTDGIEATRAIKIACPSTHILMLTMSDEEEDLYEAIKAGASGYLLKEVSIATVAGAIRSVMGGESFLSPSMASKLLLEFNSLVRDKESGVNADISVSVLTNRETEVLRQLAQGYTNKEIASTLTIAESTVKNHVRNILEKLHLQDRIAAANYAVEAHIVP